VAMSVMDLNDVTEKIAAALEAHNEALKRLSSGRGNVLSIGARIRSLGVKTKRSTPAIRIDGIAIAAEDDEPSAAPVTE
jgi:hypothetical protein